MAKSELRWWESNRNLGFAGTLAAGLLLAVLTGLFGTALVWRTVKAAWSLAMYPVTLPALVVAAFAFVAIVLVVGYLTRQDRPALPGWFSYRVAMGV